MTQATVNETDWKRAAKLRDSYRPERITGWSSLSAARRVLTDLENMKLDARMQDDFATVVQAALSFAKAYGPGNKRGRHEAW